MTQANEHHQLAADGAHKAGWLVSIVLHGSLLLGALGLLQQLHLAPQQEPFEWNVAMVEPTTSQSPATIANESPPGPLTPTQSPVPAQHSQTTEPAQPSPPPVVATPPLPASAQIEPPYSEPAPPLPVPATPSTLEPNLEPVREEPRPHEPAGVKSIEAPPKSSPPGRSTTARSASPPEQPAISAQSSAAANTQEAAALPPEPVRAQGETPPPSTPTPINTTEKSATGDSPTASTSTEMASLTPAGPASLAKSDDRWLSALMGKWIVDLEKHYPATLRLEGIQGKVVLVAILHENGILTDVKVAKSSGNTLLDQAALADVEQGPPIKLSHPLGRPQRPIKFSLSYDLTTAR